MHDDDCAVVLAGGVGSRLRPYTMVLPKPLMPVGDRPILEIVIRQLRHYGFGRVILAVNQRDALIRAVIGDGSAYGLEVAYTRETRPLGTIGPLHPVADRLPDSFLVMNGDLLTDLDFRAFLAAHRSASKYLSVGVVRREQPIDYGVVELGSDGRAVGFREKPTVDLWVSMGVYAMDRRILDYVPRDRPFGFDDLMAALLDRGIPVGVRPHRGQWHDIGRPDDFEIAAEAFRKNRDLFLPAEEPELVART
ncbi:MAG: nucleotidyltransferase family protein [Planctomycetota bacterium]|jgi:NDP-sugar pyrophosphorylase family protein